MTGSLLLLSHRTLGHLAVVLTGAGVVAAVDFSHTITLGSVLVAGIGLIIALIFTARSKIASVWRQEAEGERAAKERLQKELADEKLSRATFEKEQQLLRHDLKSEVAAVKAQLQVMEAKTDLTGAINVMREMNERTTEAIVDAMHATSRLSISRDEATHQLLTEIRDKLPAEPVAVDVVAVPDPKEK